ncbi:uncharacterized protein LOC142564778 [Dermacentor variabilis]|uniref:uncharacterized protein LOC142564778 n=1 Tax=Dermacentor variabilis TaxID=34621 RepID=UPI003F5C49C8
MRVYLTDDDSEPEVKRMTLQYTEDDGNFSCSVYFISPPDTVVRDSFADCEMYVKDSYVTQGPSESCRKFFEEKCGSSRYQPYSESCKKAIVDTNNNEINNNDYS